MPMKANDALNYAKQMLKEGKNPVRVYSWNNTGDDGTWLIDDRTDTPQTIRERPKKGKK